MQLNAEQRRCATTFGIPLAVIAGAGSGKTATLRARVANAFGVGPDGAQPPVLHDIGEVLAITFTEKAALELKSRIKAQLRESGLPEQALLVDGAWIGTIHGMCARILRENALTLGIDPAFGVIGEDVRAQLLDAAMETVLAGDDELRDGMDLLFGEYARSTVRSCMDGLIGKAVQSPLLFDSVVTPDGSWASPLDPSSADGEHDLQNVRFSHALGFWPTLRDATVRSYGLFMDAKRAQGVLDNDDLLLEVARALEVPSIREAYRDRFKLVMVDEFQDTDQMQLDIIKAFSGPGCERLCVVGDRMQGIYRFRGADLSVCNAHLGTVGEEGIIKLSANYRSHADILDFVDLVFGGDDEGEGVGDRPARGYYQRLGYQRTSDAATDTDRYDVRAEGPRISVQEVQYRGRSAAGIDAARRFAALQIARRFKAMHEETGRSYGDMAILLGAMTSAGLYAEALGSLGIPCAVTGGSVLASRTDALLMKMLVRVLANPLDAEALVAVLGSDLFGLGDADLIDVLEQDTAHARRIGPAFARLLGHVLDSVPAGEGEMSLEALEGTRVGVAVEVLARAYRRIGTVGVADAMEGVLLDSGWLQRMQHPEGGQEAITGRARAADMLKVIRMVRGLEEDGCHGPASIARQLELLLDVAKEPPGTLSAEGGGFVRIMTIHASKGLQFPIVAVSEMQGGRRSGGKLPMTSMHGRTYALLDCEAKLDEVPELKKCTERASTGKVIAEAMERADVQLADDAGFAAMTDLAVRERDLAFLHAAIRAYEDQQELEELERRLYVAFTRAEESLIVTFFNPVTKDQVEKKLKVYGRDLKGLDAGEREYLASHVNVTGLEGRLDGVPARIRASREAILRAGWGYLCTTPMWLAKWACDGSIPPDWEGRPDDASNQGDFDLDFDDVDAGGGVSPACMGEEPVAAQDDGFPLPHTLPDDPCITYRYSQQWADGLVSASGLKREDGEAVYGQAAPEVVSIGGEEDASEEMPAPATEKGTAFHEAAQWMVSRWEPGAELSMPPSGRVAAIARHHGLGAGQADELNHQLERWKLSPVAHGMASHAHLVAEAPFHVPIGDGLLLNGFIDLLAFDEMGAGEALVVDYKTGRSHDTDAKRRSAYQVQAECYAYALLLQGFDSVRLDFVFVDQPEGDGGYPAVCSFPAPGEPPYRVEALEASLLEHIDEAVRC